MISIHPGAWNSISEGPATIGKFFFRKTDLKTFTLWFWAHKFILKNLFNRVTVSGGISNRTILWKTRLFDYLGLALTSWHCFNSGILLLTPLRNNLIFLFITNQPLLILAQLKLHGMLYSIQQCSEPFIVRFQPKRSVVFYFWSVWWREVTELTFSRGFSVGNRL